MDRGRQLREGFGAIVQKSVGIVIANGFNVLYQVGMGRFLSVDNGLLSACLGMLNMVLLPLGAVA